MAQVTGAQPLACKGIGGRVWVIKIFAHDIRPLDRDLALLHRRGTFKLRSENANLIAMSNARLFSFA